MTVVIKKIGESLAIVIPDVVVRDMKLVEGAEVKIELTEGFITVGKKEVRRRRSMAEIVSQIDPASYRLPNAQFYM